MISYTPAIPLSEFVEQIYLCPDREGGQPLVHAAYPRFAMRRTRFSLGKVYGRINGVSMLAARRIPQMLRQAEIGVRFKPYGLYTGFGIPGAATFNKDVPAAILFPGTDLRRLQEALDSGDITESAAELHQMLFARLRPNPLLDEITEMTDALLRSDLSNGQQRRLCQVFQRTPKSFIALFQRAIGTTPLAYLHICKIEQAKSMIRDHPEMSLTEIGYELGFYDQAHFIRVFRKLTCLSPRAYKMQHMIQYRPDFQISN